MILNTFNDDNIKINQQNICRICLEKCNDITKCNCKGSMGFIHYKCLVNWININNSPICELCNKSFYDNNILQEINRLNMIENNMLEPNLININTLNLEITELHDNNESINKIYNKCIIFCLLIIFYLFINNILI